MININQEDNKKALLGKLGESRHLAKMLGFESVANSLSVLIISLGINAEKITSAILTEYYEGVDEFYKEPQNAYPVQSVPSQ